MIKYENSLSIFNYTDVTIVFRDGTGGDFLAWTIDELKGFEPKGNKNEKWNEYYHEPQEGRVGITHTNMWFRPSGNDAYGAEVYTYSRYKEAINYIVNSKSKIIMIVNNVHMNWTQTLGSYRYIIEEENSTLHNNMIELKMSVKNFAKDYSWWNKMISKQREVFTLEYEDLFIKNDRKVADDLCNYVGVTDKEEFYNKVVAYSNRNKDIMSGIEWNKKL